MNRCTFLLTPATQLHTSDFNKMINLKEPIFYLLKITILLFQVSNCVLFHLIYLLKVREEK